jgi:hypothetical protein
LIAQALAATNVNMTAAAKKIGIHRRTLHRKINEMNAAKAQAKKTGEFYAGPLIPVRYNRQGQRKALPCHPLLSSVRARVLPRRLPAVVWYFVHRLECEIIKFQAGIA